MGIREKVNNNPLIVTGLVVVAVIVVVLVIALQLRQLSPAVEDQAFYSDDDGKTWFTDSTSRIPPYEKDGKVAVRAYVYKCKGVAEPFVGYLARYTDTARKQLLDAQAKGLAGNIPVPPNALEFKKPGETVWTQQAIGVMCPNGRVEDLERVLTEH